MDPQTPHPYAHERTEPDLTVCTRDTPLSLEFDGSRLRLNAGGSWFDYPAVSGTPDSQGRFDYSSARQRLSNAGPIPEGRYWVQPDELWERGLAWSIIGLFDDDHARAWGNYRLTIHHYPTTQTHDRGGFFIHGGTVPGSIGCIDLTSHLDGFIAKLRELTGEGSCHIPLTVEYPEAGR